MIEFKRNLVQRKERKKDPILRRILASEDKGEDGEFFTIQIKNTDDQRIKDGPLKHFSDITRNEDSMIDCKLQEKVSYTHKKLNIEYKQMISVKLA